MTDQDKNTHRHGDTTHTHMLGNSLHCHVPDDEEPDTVRICPECDAGDPTSLFPYHEVCPNV